MGRSLWIVFAAWVLMVGCCVDPVTGGRYFCFSDVSPAQEDEIGSRVAVDFIAASGGQYPDLELHEYLQSIVIGKLAKNSHRPNLPWTFKVLNTSQINAFALPGGKVFVTRGLLARLETEAQFVHLMGHEVGHVAHKHALRGQGRNALLGIITGTLGVAEQSVNILRRKPDDPLSVSSTVGSVGGIAFLSFSREQELEADERGVDYAVELGYDPRQAVHTFEMFQRVKAAEGQGESVIQELLSTHPLDSRRIRAIDRYIRREHPEIASRSANLVVSGDLWTLHRARLKTAQSHYEKYDQALNRLAGIEKNSRDADFQEIDRLLREAAAGLPGHATPLVGLAIASATREDFAAARVHLDQALALEPQHFEVRLLRGIVLRRLDQSETAIAEFLKAHELYPSHPIPCYQLGQASEALSRWESAVEWYDEALRRAPRGSEVRRLARERRDELSG